MTFAERDSKIQVGKMIRTSITNLYYQLLKTINNEKKEAKARKTKTRD